MSYDEDDAWREAAEDPLFERFVEDPSAREHFYQELYDEIVKDFTESRLRSFYEQEPEIASATASALSDAKRFTRKTLPPLFCWPRSLRK